MGQIFFGLFEVGAPGASWTNYAEAKAAADAVVVRVNAVRGNYTYLTEFYGGSPTPNQTKCAVPFEDPEDRELAEFPAGVTTTMTELDWANDPGWQPPIDAVMAEPQASAAKAAEHTTLGKKIRKNTKKK